MTIEFSIDDSPTVIETRQFEIPVESGELWPIPARGSKYNIQFSGLYIDYDSGVPIVTEGGDDQIRRIGMKRLDEFSPGPVVADATADLIAEIRVWRNGPVIITPKGEALVWRKDDAGWNPYYVGKVNIDPIWQQYPLNKGGHPGANGLFPAPESAECSWFTPEQFGLWSGCMFKTGEPWTVRQWANRDPRLTWPGVMGKNLDSGGLVVLATAPKHAELIKSYYDVRPVGGRLYVMMGGHIWMNARQKNFSNDDLWDEVSNNMHRVLKELSPSKEHPLLKMFNARMHATKGDGRPVKEGCLPIYLGNCSDFDDGTIPVTSVGAGYASKRPISSPDRIEGDEKYLYAKDMNV